MTEHNKKLSPEYLKYIKSPEWFNFRKFVFREKGELCELCASNGVHVHHKNYSNFRSEKLNDVLVLCKSCHDNIHEIKSKKNMSVTSTPIHSNPGSPVFDAFVEISKTNPSPFVSHLLNEKKQIFKFSHIHIRTAEEELLQILGGEIKFWDGLEISDDLFADTRCVSVFRHWRDQWKSRRSVDPAAAVEALSAFDGPWLTALLLEVKSFDNPSEALAGCVKILKLSAQRRERVALEREVLDMLEGRMTRDENKINRYQELIRQLGKVS